MVRMPAAFLADAPGESVGEFNFARGVGAVAELVLEPLKMQRVDRTVGTETRHEETRQSLWGLRQHQERVTHRRREEPFVADDRVRAAVRRRCRRIGAHVGAALLLGHAHAERHAGFLPPWPERRVVAARHHLRRDFRRERRLGGKRRQRGARHRDRAQMSGLDLRRHVEARGAQHFRRRRGALSGLGPGRGVQSGGDARGHEIVIGRMKLDGVGAIALGVESVKLRRVLIGLPRQREPFRRSPTLGRMPTERPLRPDPPFALTASTSGRSLRNRSTFW